MITRKDIIQNLLLCIEICGDGGPKPFSDKFGKPKNNFHSAYIGIDWALQNFVDKQPMEDSDEEE